MAALRRYPRNIIHHPHLLHPTRSRFGASCTEIIHVLNDNNGGRNCYYSTVKATPNNGNIVVSTKIAGAVEDSNRAMSNHAANNQHDDVVKEPVDWVDSLVSKFQCIRQTTVTQYLSTLRTKAAVSLTSSLPDDERAQLLQSIQAVDVNQAKEEATHSVGEAVAKAVAEEAERNEVTMQRKQEEIMSRAEEAAVARVQNEIKIQEQRFVRDKQQFEAQLLKEDIVRKADTADAKIATATTTTTSDDHPHPVLGPTIADLGYKRIHLVSGATLASIPVWEKQRTYRHDRAKVMASDKVKTQHTGLPGVITLHESPRGQLSILDGQHRVGMIALLNERLKQGTPKTNTNQSSNHDTNVNALDLNRILVEVFPEPHTDSDSGDGEDEANGTNNNHDSVNSTHAKDLFTEINKAEPVKLVDLPGVAKSSDRKLINDAASALKEKYHPMFKASQRCRPPHLNIDNLRDALFTAGVIDKQQTITRAKDATALVEWLEAKNQEWKQKYTASTQNDAVGPLVSEKALAKAIEHDFFLGLDSGWLFQ
jgi:hypothetical protein